MQANCKTISEEIFAIRRLAYGVLDWKYHSPGVMPPALMALRGYGLLRSHSGRLMSHGSVCGIGYGQQAFTLSDVTAPPVKDVTYAGFGGVVLSLDPCKGGRDKGGRASDFHSRTIICRDRKFLNPKSIEGLKRVGLVDREFENRFEVYGSDQTEARARITPDFMERLMQFDDDYLGRNIQCGFVGGKLHICLEIDDRFDFNRMHLVDNYTALSAIVLHELAAVFTVLELGQRLQNTIGVQTDETMDAQRGVYYASQLQTITAALETPPENWRHVSKTGSNERYPNFLFDGYLGQMIKPVFMPLSQSWDKPKS
ncbi:MAG: DUF3137 domain-containing protein [Litorimonas sp.]